MGARQLAPTPMKSNELLTIPISRYVRAPQCRLEVYLFARVLVYPLAAYVGANLAAGKTLIPPPRILDSERVA